MPDSYEVSILTPCTGTQTVDKNNDQAYSGPTGDFAFANLVYNNAVWKLTTYDYRSGSNCYGVSIYIQVTPDADPTSGQYGKEDSNGDPDTNLGIAVVAP